MSDINYNKVTLLLSGDGVTGTLPVDSSPQKVNFSTGSSTLSTATVKSTVGKFGGSVEFALHKALRQDATTHVADFTTGDFTVEFWFNNAATVDMANTFNVLDIFGVSNEELVIQLYHGGLSSSTYGTTGTYLGGGSVVTTLTPGAWYHYAMVRHAGVITTYLNGAFSETWADTTDYSSATYNLYVGDDSASASHLFYLDDFRITKGVARYLATFAPPTVSFDSTTPSPVNQLVKDPTTTTTLIPGYTVKRWVPPTTSVRTVYTFQGTLNGTPEFFPYVGNAGYYIGANDVVITNANGIWIYRYVTVSGSYNVIDTIPGYYTYDVQPDTYKVTYGANRGWNSAARSGAVFSGDGTATFSVRVSAVGVVAGLNETTDSTGIDYYEITYGIYFSKGYYQVIENGVIKTGGFKLLDTDEFKVTRSGTTVYYLRNGNVFYTSAMPSTAELLLDCSLYSAGDAIYNAALEATSAIDFGSADAIGVASLTGTPKAQALVTAAGSLKSNGTYSLGNEVHISGVALKATSLVRISKDFGSVDVTATSTLTAEARVPTALSGSLSSFTALLTSGYQDYAAVSASFPRMEATVRQSSLSLTLDLLIGSFESMVGNAHCLTGQNTLPSTMSLGSMTGLLANKHYAGMSAPLSGLVANMGTFPNLGNYLNAPFISLATTGVGHSTPSTTAALSLTTLTVAGTGGAYTNLRTPLLALSATGSFTDTGQGTLRTPSFTLSSSATVVGNGAYSLRFIKSTLVGAGAANAAFSAPSLVLSGFGTKASSGTAALPLLNWAVVGSGTVVNSGHAALGWPVFSSIWSFGELSTPNFALSAKGSVLMANAVAYVLNIHTQETTQYTNYTFNHIVHIGSEAYGVRADGLYKLGGLTDSSTVINGIITTKESDLGDFHSKRIQYLYLDTDTPTTVIPFVDGVQKLPKNSSFGGRKVKLALGNSGRYHRFTIAGIKKLEGLELVPAELIRRVK